MGHENCGPLMDRSSPTTPPNKRGETSHPPDATTTPSKTKVPHLFLGEVSDEEDTDPDAKEHATGRVTSREDTKPPLPHQAGETSGVDVFYEHHIHHDPLEVGPVDHKHHGPLNDKSSPTTPLTNQRETHCPPDATTTPSKAMNPYTPLGEVSDEDITTLDVGKHAPEPGEGHHPSNDTTTPTKASDPYTITNKEPGRHGTGMPDIMDRHNPSLKTHTNINGKEYTILTGILQTHRHETLDRPDPKPPDRS